MRSFVHYISYTEQKIPSAVMLPRNLRRVRKHSVLCHFLEIRKKACAHMRLYRPAYSHSRCARADAYNACDRILRKDRAWDCERGSSPLGRQCQYAVGVGVVPAWNGRAIDGNGKVGRRGSEGSPQNHVRGFHIAVVLQREGIG